MAKQLTTIAITVTHVSDNYGGEDGTGAIPENGNAGGPPDVVLWGTLSEVVEEVEIYDGPHLLGTTTVGPDGPGPETKWNYKTPYLDPGQHLLYAYIKRSSSYSNAWRVNII